VKKGSNNKRLDIILSATQEEFENLCFIAAGQRVHELWPFILKQSYAIDLSSLRPIAYLVM